VSVIVAGATPLGRSALAVVRLSGDGLDEVLDQVVEPFRAGPWRSGRTRRVRLRAQRGVLDDGVLVVARGPSTYTGEDTAEISCHGNPLIIERLIDAAVDAGARVAEAGEFSRRALQRGRIDLVGAEAVLQISRAASARGLDVGRAALDGRMGTFLQEVRGELVGAAAELEARLDYPEEDLTLKEDDRVLDGLRGIAARCREVASTFDTGRVLVHGARVAIVGPVNAGKSSLFNALLGRGRALVHPRAGTTRDVLEVVTRLSGVEVTLLDTAGERPTEDPIEAAGLALAAQLTESADLLVVVLRASKDSPGPVEKAILKRTEARARVIVYNGVDCGDAASPSSDWIPTVAPMGQGVDALRGAIIDALGCGDGGEGQVLMIASARQRDLLLRVADAAESAVKAFDVAGVAAAADATADGLSGLDALTGRNPTESVLDALFARFCIGK